MQKTTLDRLFDSSGPRIPGIMIGGAAKRKFCPCGRRAHAHGLCSGHASRLRRHGNPLLGGTFYGEPLRLLNEVLAQDTDDCIPWQLGSPGAGYGQVQIDGKKEYVHVVVCRLKRGPPPDSTWEASHTCGNGHLRCVNWKTSDWEAQSCFSRRQEIQTYFCQTQKEWYCFC